MSATNREGGVRHCVGRVGSDNWLLKSGRVGSGPDPGGLGRVRSEKLDPGTTLGRVESEKLDPGKPLTGGGGVGSLVGSGQRLQGFGRVGSDNGL